LRVYFLNPHLINPLIHPLIRYINLYNYKNRLDTNVFYIFIFHFLFTYKHLIFVLINPCDITSEILLPIFYNNLYIAQIIYFFVIYIIETISLVILIFKNAFTMFYYIKSHHQVFK
jgi:hypothetical protein